VKLLRVLQDRTIERVCGNSRHAEGGRAGDRGHEPRPAEQDDQGRAPTARTSTIRLNVVSIVLPPLRQRKEEIPALVDRFMTEFNLRHETGVTEISPETMDLLYRHPWPGNVRELKNTIERAMVIADGDTVRPLHLKLEASRAAELDAEAPPRIAPGPARIERPAAPAPAGETGLSDRQMRTLEILGSRRVISTREVAELMDVSERTALRDLRQLISRGLVEKTGSRRAAQYRLLAEE
jgi:transcriptional regulator with PAS, ATPase and Fis domain